MIYEYFLDWLDFFGKLAGHLLSLLSPLLIGLVLAYLFDPLMTWLESRVRSRNLALTLTYLLVAAVLAGLLYGFIILILGALPQEGLTSTIRLVWTYFEDAYASAQNFFSGDFGRLLGDLGLLRDPALLESVQDWLAQRFSLESVMGFLTGLTGWLVNGFVGVVASIYLLKDKELFLRMWNQFLSLVLKRRSHGLLSETIADIDQVMDTFLKGAFIDSLLVAFLSAVILTIVKVEYAVILGCISGFLNIIPYFGPFFGMVPAFLVAAVTGGLKSGLLAVAGLFLIQQLDSNYIYPKIVGATTGLHPLFVLLAVSILGVLLGIVGMILAVPAAGILQVLVKRWAEGK